MAKQSPLSNLHVARGATFYERGGWVLPTQFEGLASEYKSVRTAVGLLDFSHRALLNFTGPDRLSYLQGMISNDLRPLEPGHGVYATVLNVQGKVVGDCRVFCTDNGFLMDLWEPIKQKVLDHLNRYLVADEVEINDEAEQYAVLSVQGPRSAALLRSLLQDKDLPPKRLNHRAARLGDCEIRITRFSHTGEDGFDLFVPTAAINSVAQRFSENGKAFAAKWVGEQAQEVLRVEAGIPLYGVDFTEDNLLLEVELPHAVSFEKGCYLGQEVVERIRSRGHVNKRLCGLLLSAQDPVPSGATIRAGEKEVGAVTSCIYSPALEQAIALGYVHREFWAPATVLHIQHAGSGVQAQVTALPFLPAKDPALSSLESDA